MHWYKRDPDASYAGMAELTLEECGAYNLILDLLYARDGELPDDDALLARLLRCQPRKWVRLKESLTAYGKIWTVDGKITGKRVEKTILEAKELSNKQSQTAKKRWNKDEIPSENKEPSMPDGNASTTTTTTTTTKKRKTPAAEPPEFAEFWASKPSREGANPRWPAVQAYVKAMKNGADPAQVNAAAKRWNVESGKTEPRFIKTAVAWLNARMYEDYHAPPERETNLEYDEINKRWKWKEGFTHEEIDLDLA